jgi:hypothetical protein
MVFRHWLFPHLKIIENLPGAGEGLGRSHDEAMAKAQTA